MARKLSRRSLARFVADGMVDAAQYGSIVKQLAAHLVETRRTKELGLILRDVEAVLMERGIVMGTIISAAALSADTIREIEQFVTRQTSAKSVNLDYNVDPEVIGGVKLSLPGRELDQTVSYQLTALKTRFKKA
jgi:F0F1-type ATP synthase delta subunit